MEIPLVMMAILLLLVLYYLFEPDSAVRKYGVPVALVLCALSRPELFVMVPLVFVDTWFYHMRQRTPEARRKAWTILVTEVIVFGVAISPYFAFNLITSGHLLPTTFYAKTSVRDVGLSGALASKDIGRIKTVFTDHSIREVVAVFSLFMKQNLVGFLLLPVGTLFFVGAVTDKISRRGWFLPLPR